MFNRTANKMAVSILPVLLMMIVGCGEQTPSFSLLPEEDIFQQNNDKVLNAKMDILWVIDNSGSMDTSQANTANNFNVFINDFVSKGFDYQIAVTTTEAYVRNSDFRDGTNSTSHTGYPIITPSTPDLVNTFMINVVQGVSGSGDERAFQSMKAALDDTDNAGFVRNDAFLAIVIVSDEDDISRDGAEFQPYSTNDLHATNDYLTYLDGITGSTEGDRRYNISAMAIQDEECRDFLNQSWTGRKIGARYGELADATGGVKGDLCGDFAADFDLISKNIIQQATQFYLSRIPIPETIRVIVNGQLVPNRNNNPGPTSGGWSYNAESNSIMFHGDHIPNQGDKIKIDYDPVNYGS
ncbi:MAG: hypothetical protein H6626_03405 [Pseudobdellovibrionaceae bacterium]|nr:hypothetical protein [Bdellovibrionales bacterium]USN48148.1 MAG: hypothetical protein H6626_03405 [Pseudobdellovibrionaceae bacterium]